MQTKDITTRLARAAAKRSLAKGMSCSMSKEDRRQGGLPPQRLLLPAGIESHSRLADCRVLRQQRRQVFGEIPLFNGHRRIEEPERPVSQRELMDDARPQGNLYALDGTEQQLAQLHIERVERGHLLKRRAGAERVVGLLEDAQVGSEAEVADIVEELLGLCRVLNGEATLLQGGQLVSDAEGGFVVFHKYLNKKVPPWYAGQREARMESDGAKVRTFRGTAKHFGKKVKKKN